MLERYTNLTSLSLSALLQFNLIIFIFIAKKLFIKLYLIIFTVIELTEQSHVSYHVQ